jgi:hypothetical protein
MTAEHRRAIVGAINALLAVMRNEEAPTALRIEAAKALAPYFHEPLPRHVLVEVKAAVNGAFEPQHKPETPRTRAQRPPPRALLFRRRSCSMSTTTRTPTGERPNR